MTLQIQKEDFEIYKFEQQKLKLFESSTKHYEYHKWFLDNSKGFTETDKNLSRQKQKEYKSKLKQCHSNCMRIFSDEHFSDSRLKLFTGFEWSKNIGIPLEHTWLVLNDKVIDPTLAIKANGDSDRFAVEYLGIEIPFSTMNKLMLELKVYTNFLPYMFQKLVNNNV